MGFIFSDLIYSLIIRIFCMNFLNECDMLGQGKNQIGKGYKHDQLVKCIKISNNVQFMKELTTEIVIHADVSLVWNTLIDLERYSEWNPFITEASGKIKKGNKLCISVLLPGDEQYVFNPVVKHVDYHHEIIWKGHHRIPVLFNWVHTFEFDVRGKETCVFRQSIKFSGISVPFIWDRVGSPCREGSNKMNQKLKKRAEAMAIKNRADDITRSLSNRMSRVS